ncbi:MAG: 2-hydroxyglutaryl-CoA dehydratase [Oscillospiraceae bacterium]|nr:2-hydroxyglutaryl-CoA dehydratase [Oscillospiraceae bacterium]
MYIGIDVGSISTDIVLMHPNKSIYKKLYIRTNGDPVNSVTSGINTIFSGERDIEILGAGTTGSGRGIAAAVTGADVVKNEITAHGVAAVEAMPDVRTVLEIGGQDSKIIFIEDGIITDFNMNTVCAAGTGSFLDRQAGRLGMEVQNIGEEAKKSTSPCSIAGRCAVFAESDMIHKQQEGAKTEDILAGLCDSLVRNFINNLCSGKNIEPPVIFQGGVAANSGIVRAFKRELETDIIIPPYYNVMGAWGAAILAKENREKTGKESLFKGKGKTSGDWNSQSEICSGCENRCALTAIYLDGNKIGSIGSRCGNC